ncbi:MAG: hypothetical protein WCP32_06145 [Bacteroidota bacterium]
MKTRFTLLFTLMIISTSLIAQVGINADGSLPDSSAGLDVNFNNKGFLPPRMTHFQRDAILNPAEGLMVICTDCGLSNPSALAIFINGAWRLLTGYCTSPIPPISDPSTATSTSITWNWNTVPGATGYKWNIANEYATATDMGILTTKSENGLACNSAFTRFVWAYNECGNSSTLFLNKSTTSCSFICGDSFTISHVAGVISPINKMVTYGTVNNVPGEALKCWITSNLGANNQANSVNDTSEASAGWYWQFNRKQGYKHDGLVRTPNNPWITAISENLEWETSNDPCSLELGNGWRIPTLTEWTNLVVFGGWIDWNGTWNSLLKIHAAGMLSNSTGSLGPRGSNGRYWSSKQSNTTDGNKLFFSITSCYLNASSKTYGFPLRCIKDL